MLQQREYERKLRPAVQQPQAKSVYVTVIGELVTNGSTNPLN